MKRLGADVSGARIFCSASVADFAAIEQLALPPRPMAVLIAADASTVSVNLVARVAERFLDAGLGFICAWGPDCERVHDVFDREYVGDGMIERDLFMMSTWHAHESLEDAVEFFALSFVECDTRPVSHLAIAVGNPAWASIIDSAVSRFVRINNN